MMIMISVTGKVWDAERDDKTGDAADVAFA